MLSEAVTDADFTISSMMTGGAGGNCTTGQACQSNADCQSQMCVMATNLCL
jgi:hypothetical protein